MASEEQISDRILTVPNLVSFARLGAIPVFCWLVLGPAEWTAATALFALVALTDWVDGYLARRLDQVTRLGKALDPVADRLLIASAIVVGLIAGIVPAVIGLSLIVREVYMTLLTFTVVSRRGGVLEVRRLGKLATLIVYSSVGWFYIAAIGLIELLALSLAWAAGIVGLALYWITAIQYTGDALRIMSELESAASSEES